MEPDVFATPGSSCWEESLAPVQKLFSKKSRSKICNRNKLCAKACFYQLFSSITVFSNVELSLENISRQFHRWYNKHVLYFLKTLESFSPQIECPIGTCNGVRAMYCRVETKVPKSHQGGSNTPHACFCIYLVLSMVRIHRRYILELLPSAKNPKFKKTVSYPDTVPIIPILATTATLWVNRWGRTV